MHLGRRSEAQPSMTRCPSGRTVDLPMGSLPAETARGIGHRCRKRLPMGADVTPLRKVRATVPEELMNSEAHTKAKNHYQCGLCTLVIHETVWEIVDKSD